MGPLNRKPWELPGESMMAPPPPPMGMPGASAPDLAGSLGSNNISSQATPQMMPPPPPSDPGLIGVTAKLANMPPVPQPSANPKAFDGLKQAMPPAPKAPLNPVAEDAGEMPTPPSHAQIALNKYDALQAPVAPKPGLAQRLAAAAVGGMAGWSNAAGRMPHPIDIGAATSSILRPGYAQKMADYNQQKTDALGSVKVAEAYDSATALEEQRKAKAQALKDKSVNDANEEQRKRDADVTSVLVKGWRQVPSGAPIPPGYVKGTLHGQDFAVPTDDTTEQRKYVPIPKPIREYYGIKDERGPQAYVKDLVDTYKVDNHPDPAAKADPNHWADTINDPNASPQAKQRATANLRTIRENQVQKAQELHIINAAGGQSFAPPPGDPSLNGDAYLKTIPPGLAGTVRAIAEGRQHEISGFALTKPAGQQIMAAVNQYDPQYDANRAGMRRAYLTGPQGTNVGNLNTGIVHLDQLQKAADAMQNKSLQPGNALYNYVATTFGANTVTNFDSLKSVVAGELANALKGNATDAEIHEIQKNIQSKNSPDQLSGFMNTMIPALNAKLNTHKERYQREMNDHVWSPVLPSAQEVLDRRGAHASGENQTANNNPNPTGYVVGHIYGGLTYLGPDPNKQSSWKK